MYGSDAYVNWFLETSAFLSDRLKLWFERDRQLHAIELRLLFDMLHWKLDHTFDLHAAWQLIIDAEKSNGKIPPIVEFAPSSGELITARTAHQVAAQVAIKCEHADMESI